ncbi:MAG: cytochrome b/b6 domain-containing protein [Bacteroidales bacterium]|jgi:thiosulfate reductase cytochrome b subunit|nr:cytochrome b/b6 domain-containing protein [Bacteroidales bacterium]
MYLYPLWVRLWHVLNAVLVIILIITGISMQYTGKHGYILLVGFASAVKWHNIAAVILTFNYIVFVTANVVTGNGRHYRIEKKNFFSDLGKQLLYYSRGMFKGKKHPFPVSLDRKFNPLQKLTYVLTMYVALPLLIISGLGLMFPEVTINKVFGVSGLILTDILHITLGFFISIFLVIHIYTCTLGSKPTSLFRSIITGYHEPDEE